MWDDSLFSGLLEAKNDRFFFYTMVILWFCGQSGKPPVFEIGKLIEALFLASRLPTVMGLVIK